jgi:hypothetical protein
LKLANSGEGVSAELTQLKMWFSDYFFIMNMDDFGKINTIYASVNEPSQRDDPSSLFTKNVMLRFQ